MRVHQWYVDVIVISLAAVLLCLSKPTDKRTVLLPPSLSPEHYEISLAPRIDRGVFRGVVAISGVAIEQTDTIVLHCKSLRFNSTSVTDLTADEELEVVDITEDVLLHRCHILLNDSLHVDHEYRLTVDFMGVIGKGGIGLYRDSYKEEGVKHDIMMTHFQPNYARTMFPCFDEPHYKAQFLLKVTQQHFPTVISNMPISAVSPPDPEENNRTWIEFEETPPMSTYLLVLVMCDYLALTDSTTNTSVWAPKSRLHEAQLALNISVAVLSECERYFNAEYVLPKLDHVPVPSLNLVAMENWGAIIYQTEYLLWEEGVSTWSKKEMMSHVICHEIIHQWLGNLVTTAWWNTTWLNEGVTSFYHYYIMDKVEPSWNVMDTMFVTQILMVLNEEASNDAKPLTNNEPILQDAISSQAFSTSTYLKGAAIIRMVFNLMAPDVFREAMVQYIQENEYGSVDEEDLWQSLAVAADLPVNLEYVMYFWTHQPGFPLVTVLRGSDGCITVKQEKYLATDESNARWTIPITYTSSSELDFNFSNTVWFPEDRLELELEECLEPTEWIILNIRQTGFYRVNYDPLTWHALTHDLQNCDLADIHPVNRGQLLHDGFDLMLNDHLDPSVVLELSRYLTRETEYLPWFVAIHWFNQLRTQFLHSDTFPHFQRYTLSLVDDVFSNMSLTEELGDVLAEMHRKQIVEFACRLGHTQCVKHATDTAYLLMSGVDVRIPVELKPVLLCSAVRYGQDEVWHFVLKAYLGAADNERLTYLLALVCTTNMDTVQRLLKDVANPKSFVKETEERLTLLLELGKQDDTLEHILDMILRNFQVLSTHFDFEVILNLLKLFLPPELTPQEEMKIIDIKRLVVKTQSSKQVEVMESIMKEVDNGGPVFTNDPVAQWFIDQGQDEEEVITTLSPEETTVSTTAMETTTDYEDELSSSEVSEEEDDSEDTVVTEAPPVHNNNNNDAGDSSSMVRANLTSVVLILLICVFR